MSDLTIEQRLDILLRRYRKAITLEEGDAFYQEELIASIENDFVQLLNEARIDELNKKLPKVLDYTMTPEQTSMIVNRLDELELQLTPKENKQCMK